MAALDNKKTNTIQSEQQRIIGLDILRIGLALFIFCFHSRVHLSCDYGVLNYLFDSPNLGMIGFFMLSGYALQLAYNANEMTEPSHLKKFYLKRLISIYPLYIIMGYLSVLLSIIVGRQSLLDNIVLLPVKIFDGSLFSYAHNGGTWFISCIFGCYFLFPFIKSLSKNITIKVTFWIIVVLVVLLTYVHFLPSRFPCGDLYTNPFFRFFEFFLGMLIAKLNISIVNNDGMMRIIRSWPVLLIAIIVLLVGYSYCRFVGIKSYFLVYTCFVIVFLCLGYIKFPKNLKNKFILYASSLSFAVYLSQGLVWKFVKFLQLYVGEINNFVKITGSFMACVIISIFFHEFVEKRFGSYIKKKIIP